MIYKGIVNIVKNGKIISRNHNAGRAGLFEAISRLFTTNHLSYLPGCLPSKLSVSAESGGQSILNDKVPLTLVKNDTTGEDNRTCRLVFQATITPHNVSASSTSHMGIAYLQLFTGDPTDVTKDILLCECTVNNLMEELDGMNSEDEVHVLWNLIFTDGDSTIIEPDEDADEEIVVQREEDSNE